MTPEDIEKRAKAQLDFIDALDCIQTMLSCTRQDAYLVLISHNHLLRHQLLKLQTAEIIGGYEALHEAIQVALVACDIHDEFTKDKTL